MLWLSSLTAFVQALTWALQCWSMLPSCHSLLPTRSHLKQREDFFLQPSFKPQIASISSKQGKGGLLELAADANLWCCDALQLFPPLSHAVLRLLSWSPLSPWPFSQPTQAWAAMPLTHVPAGTLPPGSCLRLSRSKSCFPGDHVLVYTCVP